MDVTFRRVVSLSVSQCFYVTLAYPVPPTGRPGNVGTIFTIIKKNGEFVIAGPLASANSKLKKKKKQFREFFKAVLLASANKQIQQQRGVLMMQIP
jgi:hypothetical protein